MPSLIANDTGQGDQKNSNVFFISFRGEEELVKLKDFLLTNWAILHPNHFLMTTCKWRLFRMASSIHQRSNQINAFWSSQLLFSWSLQDRHAFFSFFLLKWAGKRHFLHTLLTILSAPYSASISCRTGNGGKLRSTLYGDLTWLWLAAA